MEKINGVVTALITPFTDKDEVNEDGLGQLIERQIEARVGGICVSAGSGEFVNLTPEERAMIEAKMAQLGTTNMGAYLRKMAIDGYVVRLDLSDISELVSLLRRSSNNLNQYTKRAHENGRIYEADIEAIQSSLKSVWEKADQIMTRLSTID